ncbi:enterobactin synthase subunit EntD [Enterobacter sp. RHBSTW-00994]|uniref:enterobactin synthase subunit EntD n=1 Tax=Enterobacter sp. RHBSTW-00994 TaxID=2742676 RepID=UPI0015EA4814|nr:enterobactin synthase subunit EntD [Enterobacter sp. RHBSTW-00994]QLR42215.1 enterobactin synthase subunit EntD [Enterobacter sp. RHBSTW-00994]
MQTTHTTFPLADQTVHRITFDLTTFTDADLLWLPHHAQITPAGRKRKAEHLAGRIAAAHALSALHDRTLPGIGPNGEPLWSKGISGSITHSGSQAMAIAIRHQNALIGIDCEAILSENDAQEIKGGIIDPQEDAILSRSGFPFALALTLTFSAKESLFKALFPQVKRLMGFDCARVLSLNDTTLTLELNHTLNNIKKNQNITLSWCRFDATIVTLLCRI